MCIDIVALFRYTVGTVKNCEALAAGANLAVLGNELMQFGDALPLGGGRFRLSRLLRGRGASEWACTGHAAGDLFCLLKAGTIQSLPLPNWSVGATLTATAPGGPAASIQFAGESVRPPAPVDLVAQWQPSGELFVSWTRRSRQGFAWTDGIDAPLGEVIEQYRVNMIGIAGSLQLTATQPLLEVPASDAAALGSGELMIEVRQIGDVAASRPAQLTLGVE